MPTRPPIHKASKGRTHDQIRGSAASRGYDARWRRARLWFLQQNPLCVECLKAGRTEAATVVDHIEPHKGDVEKFWNVKKWQALCARHHNVKTATQDGGFGRNATPTDERR